MPTATQPPTRLSLLRALRDSDPADDAPSSRSEMEPVVIVDERIVV